MPTVTVKIRNTDYPIACDSGQGGLLQSLASVLDQRIGSVSDKGSDLRMLIMTALTMENEIQDLKEKLEAQSPDSTHLTSKNEDSLCQEINNITQRLETIASKLDQV